MMTDIVVTQADRVMAEMWDIECHHCSEYDGDYRTDLAEAFARHRQATAEEVERLREALEWYADEMCEGLCLGKDPKACANIGADNCAGCPAVVALTGDQP